MVTEFGAKLAVEAQLVIAENMISVGHSIIKDLYLIAQTFGWNFKPRSILATHAFDQVGIKRSWHSIEGGSVISWC